MTDHHVSEAARGQTGGAYHDAQTAPRWDEEPTTGPLGRAGYALGSLVSVGLVVGLCVWGYQLVARDVSGVPVVRAATGPMRVQPEEPGGRQAQNQGLSVNDVAAVGSAGKAPDQLILAPAPLDLTEDDAPVRAPEPEPEAARQAAADPASESSPDAASEPQDDIAEESTEEGNEADADADEGSEAMIALAEALSDGVTPMIPLADAPREVQTPEDAAVAAAVQSAMDRSRQDDTQEDGAQEDASEITGGIARSLRPRARPAELRNIRQVAASAATGGARDVDPGNIAVGTRLAQLGAFSSEEIARAEWDKLGARFEEYLTGKDRVIQRATSGGRTFYRLRAHGFEDLADARRFCSALVAEKAECIPVVTR